MTIAERIMLIIEDKNLNMSQFADLLNVTPAYISKIKKNSDTVPSDRILNDICRLFHINNKWLREGIGDMYQPKTKAEEIAEITRQLFDLEENDPRQRLAKLVVQMTPEQLELVKNLTSEIYNAFYNDSEN